MRKGVPAERKRRCESLTRKNESRSTVGSSSAETCSKATPLKLPLRVKNRLDPASPTLQGVRQHRVSKRGTAVSEVGGSDVSGSRQVSGSFNSFYLL